MNPMPDTTARVAAQREALAWAVNELQDQATWLRKERKALEAMEADQRATILAALSESLIAHPTDAPEVLTEVGRAQGRSEPSALPDAQYRNDIPSVVAATEISRRYNAILEAEENRNA